MSLFSSKNNVITYTVNKELTSNLYISVQNGEVVINAPWYMASSQIQRVVEEKRQWILNKIKEYETSCEEKRNTIQMQMVRVLGKNYKVEVQYKMIKLPSLSFKENNIQVLLPISFKKLETEEVMTVVLNKMYEKIAEKEVERAMEKTRILLDIAPEDYQFKRMEGCLANCKEGIITINPSIVMYGRDIIDYIVLHEFCHLKYQNHTKSFYKMLKTYLPNYEEKVKELNGIAY